MKVQLRIPRPLIDRVRADLSRAHPHAAERVGFLFARTVSTSTGRTLVLFTDYSTLDDDRYLHDPWAGARIDSGAIRGAMQQVLDRREGVFHVHMHPDRGRPFWSTMDRDELPRLILGFQAVGPGFAHGLFLLSADECTAAVWLPNKQEPTNHARISVVGTPMQIFER